MADQTLSEVQFDTEGGDEESKPLINYAKVILREHGGVERHVTITHEGIFVDIVKDGTVLGGTHVDHAEFFTLEGG